MFRCDKQVMLYKLQDCNPEQITMSSDMPDNRSEY